MLLPSKKILCFLLLTIALLLTCCTFKSKFDDDLSNDVLEDDENGKFENNDNDSLHNSPELPGEGVEDDEKIYPINPDDTTKPSEPETPSDPETPSEPETPSNPEAPDEPSEPEVKLPVAHFNDLAAGMAVTDTLITSGGISFKFNNNCKATVSIAGAKDGKGNLLQFIKNDPERGGTVTFYGDTALKNRIVAEFDLTVNYSTYSVPMQISLGTSFRLQLSYSVGYVKVNDARSDGSVVNYLGINRELGDTMSIRIEYYLGDGTAANQYAKIYCDGKLYAISQNSYYAEPRNTNSNILFYSLNSSDTQYTLDNVRTYTDDATFVDDGNSSVRYYLVSGNVYDGDEWDVVGDVIGDEESAKLRELSEMFDERYYIWLANLYDPKTGGFYFSNDGRDYLGFLPDVESTAQAFSLMERIGLGKAQDMYTDEMRERIVAWVQSLESEEDGYFYHPQWGTDIGSGRLGRDLGWAIGILNRFSAEPLYPTALDRLSENVSSTVSLTAPVRTSLAVAVSHVVAVNSNDHLKSEESFIAYLDSLYEKYTTVDANGNVDFNSYSCFGVLNSHTREIQAAGLAKVCMDYVDKKQNPETGLWEDSLSYRSASGVLKISALYEMYKTEMQYGEQLTSSMIKIICSLDPVTDAVYVYNPIAGLANVLSNLNRFKNNGNNYQIYMSSIDLMRESASEIIDNTREKLSGFKRSDGSFSYLLTGSTASSSGAPVSFGGDEGDVNGAALCQSTVSNLYKLFGVNPPARFGAEDAEAFWNIIYTKESTVKKSVNTEPIDFENTDGAFPSQITTKLNSDGGSITLERDTEGGYLHIESTPGAGDTVTFTAGCGEGERNAYVFSFDINYISANNTVVNQIFFRDKSARNIIGFNIAYSNGMIRITESTSAGGGDVIIPWVSAEGKVHISIEMTPDDGSATLTVTSIGETYEGVTTKLFNESSPSLAFHAVSFYCLNGSDVVIRLDNVATYENIKYIN